MDKIIILMLAGCSAGAIGSKDKTTTCTMSGFEGFPDKVTGPVSFELKNFLTIAVTNKDGSERIEMTFPKGKCNAK